MVLAFGLGLALAGCATRAPPPAAPPTTDTVEPILPPATTRGEFTIVAGMLDTWNAVGQIVVRTPGTVYEGRAQMLGLYSVRYRDEPMLVLTRALLLSDTIRDTTTLVTAKSPAGKPLDSDAAAELLALLQRELPAEIASVRARQAAEQKAKAGKGAKKKRK